MSVRELVMQDRPTRVIPLAKEAGVSAGTIYNLARRGELETIKIGRSILVPARAARRLLGLDEKPSQPATA